MKKFYFAISLISILILISACQTQPIYYGNQNKETLENLHKDSNLDMKNVDLFNTINNSKFKGSNVEYLPNVSGYLAIPTKEGVFPSVILIHEWWGLNDNIKTMANLLAQEGYVVLAVDLYEGEYGDNSSEAAMLAGAVRANQTGAIKNMRAAAAFLRNTSKTNGAVASMGWCFGGGESLQLALSGEQMAATVIYYGNLINDTVNLSTIDWPVLGVFGANDSSIPVSSVLAFDNALDELNVDNDILIYPNVGHAFANPSGVRYAANETIDAWNKTITFLNKHLK